MLTMLCTTENALYCSGGKINSKSNSITGEKIGKVGDG